jgi:glyoxylase-like metal-dependent hydrolase (beta-lactamase superfamily II)
VNRGEQILPGLWRFEALHPEWTPDEGGEEGWEQLVAWWALDSGQGVVLIDPLVEDWTALDQFVADRGGVAGVLRTIHWHQRSVAEAADRYASQVCAMPPPAPATEDPFDRAIHDGDELFGVLRATEVERTDEVAFWLAEQRALLFADAMLRRPDGGLRVCPDSWLQPEGGPARLRQILRRLSELPAEHVLVSHGPLVLGDGPEAMASALA